MSLEADQCSSFFAVAEALGLCASVFGEAVGLWAVDVLGPLRSILATASAWRAARRPDSGVVAFDNVRTVVSFFDEAETGV